MSDDAPGGEHGGDAPTPPLPPAWPPPHWPPPGTGPGPGYRREAGPVDVLGRPMAQWWQRLVAFGLDVVILAVPISVIVSVVAGNTLPTGLAATTSVSPEVWEAVGVAFVVTLGYFSFLDGGRSGQTVGKMAVGIAVRDNDTGAVLGAGRALLRRFVFFAMYFGLILFVLNALSPLWDARRRAWHDKMAGSCVVTVR